MKTFAGLKWALIALSLSAAGCNEAEKKALEAKAAAEAKAKVDAKKAEEAAKAAAEAKAKEVAAMVATQKAELSKKLTDGLEAIDAKAAPLIVKAGKLGGAAKAKGKTALAAFAAAKSKAAGLKGQVEGASEPAALADLSTQATAALGEVQTAYEAIEALVSPPKKKKK